MHKSVTFTIRSPHAHARSRWYASRSDYIYNLHTWRHILTESRGCTWNTDGRARARTRIRIYVRAGAGVFWYIDRAWSAISPFLPSSFLRLFALLAPPRTLPRPCTPTPPSGVPVAVVVESSCSPRDVTHPENLRDSLRNLESHIFSRAPTSQPRNGIYIAWRERLFFLFFCFLSFTDLPNWYSHPCLRALLLVTAIRFLQSKSWKTPMHRLRFSRFAR